MKFFFSLFLLLVLAEMGEAQAQNIPGQSSREISCASKTAKIMILGTYHMDNPGLDAANLEADDVLLPKRQREIAVLNVKLARFNPTKIAVEGAYSDKSYWDSRYKKFLAGEYKLGRNEIEQIGFQLAKQLNHATLYPIDYPMFMSGLRYDEVESPKLKPSASQMSGKVNTARQVLSESDLLLRRSTVIEFLLNLNKVENYSKNHGDGYLRQFMSDDKEAIYENADRISNWYKRNLRMFANINRITEFPNDRILLIVGSGHLKILTDFALDSPQFCLVEAEHYLK